MDLIGLIGVHVAKAIHSIHGVPRVRPRSRPPTPGAKNRAELADRLRVRRPEIEDAFFARASAIGDLSSVDDAEYQDGFRRAIHAAGDFAVSIVEKEGEIPPIPVALLSQARLAARNAVGLDTIVRRYSAGAALFEIYIVGEINQEDWSVSAWQRLAYDRVAAVDSLIAATTEEHRREQSVQRHASLDRALMPIRCILDGESPERFDIGYSFEADHVALVAGEAGADAPIRALATLLDGRLLAVQPNNHSTWGWIGCREDIGRERVAAAARACWPGDIPLGLGEPSHGLAGWRLSHRQASAAIHVALREAIPFAQYGDVCMRASVLRDELLASTLRSLYVQPLLDTRDGGDTYLRTLCTYFEKDRNASSTAAALGISRQAVTNRLRNIEELLGRPLSTCAVAMELALYAIDCP